MMDVLELSFEVDGKTYTLTPPNPRIAFQASRIFGGVAKALPACQMGDLDAYMALLKIACPEAPKKERELQEFVFANVPVINYPLSRYAQSLQFGGRTPPTIDEALDQGEREADAAADGQSETQGGNAEAASAAGEG